MKDNKSENITPEIKWTLWDKITLPFYRVKNFISIKCWGFRKKCQRFKRGYAQSDVWNMDAWFINTAKPMLEDLLKNHHGYPTEISNEEWEAILQEMIDCITLMDEDNATEHLGISDDDYSIGSYEKIMELMNTSKKRFFELFERWFYCLWD